MESIKINSKVSTQQQKSLKQKENVHRPSATSQNQIQGNVCRQNPVPVVSIQPSYMSHLPSICSQQGYLTPNPQPSMQVSAYIGPAILGNNGTANKGTKEKVGKNGTLM